MISSLFLFIIYKYNYNKLHLVVINVFILNKRHINGSNGAFGFYMICSYGEEKMSPIGG